MVIYFCSEKEEGQKLSTTINYFLYFLGLSNGDSRSNSSKDSSFAIGAIFSSFVSFSFAINVSVHGGSCWSKSNVLLNDANLETKCQSENAIEKRPFTIPMKNLGMVTFRNRFRFANRPLKCVPTSARIHGHVLVFRNL